MNTCRCWNWASLVFVACVSLTGCGGADRPPLGYVTGTVTMDGKPLGNVIVVMKPDVGRAAMVRADENGVYDMQYIEGERGTKTGPTTVTFEWPLDHPAPVPIPRKYTGVDSVLRIDVKDGENKFDFQLESDPGAAQQSVPIPD